MSEDLFKRAAYFIANSPPNPNATNEQKLEIYGLYKQGNFSIPIISIITFQIKK